MKPRNNSMYVHPIVIRYIRTENIQTILRDARRWERMEAHGL